MNSRIRSNGLSSYEQWIGRNQFNKSQLDIMDRESIDNQASMRKISNHKTLIQPSHKSSNITTGSIVYIISEKTKHAPRPRYIVDRTDGSFLFFRKLGESVLRTNLYKVHRNACVKISPSEKVTHPSAISAEQSSHSDTDVDTDCPHETDSSQPSRVTPTNASTRPRRECRPPGWLHEQF